MTAAPERHLALQPEMKKLTGQLIAAGRIRSVQVANAFLSVPRHLFLSGFYPAAGDDRVQVQGEPPRELLDLAYSDSTVTTHRLGGGVGHSSSSQPSVMAEMLELLELRPGMRVLEIGAGTGYNSALISTITQTPVITVEATRQVADEAAAAVAANGYGDLVRVVAGDGYLGWSDGAPYDRIIVTCGIRGVAQTWFEQLAPDGFIIAPIAHGGLHPLMRIENGADGPTCHAIAMADFIVAGGPLYEGGRHTPELREVTLPAAEAARDNSVPADLPAVGGYDDLWFHLGARDGRTTKVHLPGSSSGAASCGLVTDDDTSAVLIQRGTTRLAGPAGETLATAAAAAVEEWLALGRPKLADRSSPLRSAGRPSHPIWVPTQWSNGR
ncbi:protein-L-isoaspartate O-methyltransferase [Streptomyces sp. NPDC056544]|uniref:protein-L-isoaspartate O-methyltransferase family protein n=1 Tax=unclassified Streptomyces TaxID=2593676 RepID=UPI003695C984